MCGIPIVWSGCLDPGSFETIFNSTNDLISIVNRSHVYLMINEAYVRVYGRPREQILGRTVSEVWGHDRFNAVIRSRFELCLAGNPVRDQAWINCGAAGVRFLDIAYTPFVDGENQCAALVISHDITELKLAEQELAVREERYRLLVDSSLDLIMTTDSDGDLIYLNPTASTYFKLGKNLLVFVHGEDLERMRNALVGLRQGEPVRNMEIRIQHPDGRCRYLQLTASPNADRAGDVHENVIIARDISHERRFDMVTRDYVLSSRESEVLRLVSQGFTNLNIARRLEIQESTVKFHINRIFRKTGSQNRTELSALLNV